LISCSFLCLAGWPESRETDGLLGPSTNRPSSRITPSCSPHPWERRSLAQRFKCACRSHWIVRDGPASRSSKLLAAKLGGLAPVARDPARAASRAAPPAFRLWWARGPGRGPPPGAHRQKRSSQRRLLAGAGRVGAVLALNGELQPAGAAAPQALAAVTAIAVEAAAAPGMRSPLCLPLTLSSQLRLVALPRLPNPAAAWSQACKRRRRGKNWPSIRPRSQPGAASGCPGWPGRRPTGQSKAMSSSDLAGHRFSPVKHRKSPGRSLKLQVRHPSRCFQRRRPREHQRGSPVQGPDRRRGLDFV